MENTVQNKVLELLEGEIRLCRMKYGYRFARAHSKDNVRFNSQYIKLKDNVTCRMHYEFKNNLQGDDLDITSSIEFNFDGMKVRGPLTHYVLDPNKYIEEGGKWNDIETAIQQDNVNHIKQYVELLDSGRVLVAFP